MQAPSKSAISELLRTTSDSAPFTPRAGHAGITPAGLGRPTPAAPHTVGEALSALVRIGDWRCLPYLIWLLEYPELRSAAFETIRALMPNHPGELSALDQAARETAAWSTPRWWPSARPFPWPERLPDREAFDLVGAVEEDVLLTGFMSFVANGRARETAVRVLSKWTDGRELPFLLLRMNDWVEPISRRAMRACSARLRLGYEPCFARWWMLVARLCHQHRWHHQAFVDQAEEFLMGTEQGRGALLDDLRRDDWRSRRTQADLISRRFPVSSRLRPEIISMTTDGDPIIRTRGLEALARLASEDELRKLLPSLCLDRSANVRRRVFALAEARMPELADRLAQDLLFDRNMWLREFARQRLKRTNNTDFANVYRSAIAHGRQLEGALLGLMDTGGTEHAALASAHLESPMPRIRRAAFLAAAALMAQDAAPVLLKGLASAHARLSKTAAERIAMSRAFIPSDTLVDLSASDVAHVRRHALRILQARDPWAALVVALRLRRDRDDRVAKAAWLVLAKWRTIPASMFTTPTAAQRAELLRHSAELKDAPDVRKVLETVLAQ